MHQFSRCLLGCAIYRQGIYFWPPCVTMELCYCVTLLPCNSVGKRFRLSSWHFQNIWAAALIKLLKLLGGSTVQWDLLCLEPVSLPCGFIWRSVCGTSQSK